MEVNELINRACETAKVLSNSPRDEYNSLRISDEVAKEISEILLLLIGGELTDKRLQS